MTTSIILNIDNLPTILGYVISIILLLVGITIILTSKKNKKIIDNPIKETNTKKEKNNFDKDSILKIIPTFSFNKFYNELDIQIKNKLNIENTIKDIINFKDEKDKYIIITKINNKYLISLEKYKERYIYVCPNCGGKIKDQNPKRCKFCHKEINIKINENNWNIFNIEEI